ncbi:hypothetical protein D9M70_524890 [compost metagenome]
MPPEIIGELLRPTIHFPLPEHIEALMIEQEDAAGRLAVAVGERVDVNAFRPAMGGVQPRIVRLLGNFRRLDHAHDLRIARVRLGVDDVQTGGPQARHDQIATFDMRMRRIGAETGRTGVPAEMVQLVADIRHVDLADDLRIG